MRNGKPATFFKRQIVYADDVKILARYLEDVTQQIESEQKAKWCLLRERDTLQARVTALEAALGEAAACHKMLLNRDHFYLGPLVANAVMESLRKIGVIILSPAQPEGEVRK